jgi:riboflavin synthase
MFSGIIEEIGKIKSVKRTGSGIRLEVLAEKIKRDIKKGDSVAVNGVCLSILDAGGSLSFDVVHNTLKNTNIPRLRTGDSVNLERAMKLGDRISGHMVTGHIDGERPVRKNLKTANGWIMDIGLVDGDLKYLVPRGAVAVDGVSLTVGDFIGSSMRVFLIPITLESTNLKLKKSSDYVNVEFDIMAKYSEKSVSGNITMDTLKRTGFSQ